MAQEIPVSVFLSFNKILYFLFYGNLNSTTKVKVFICRNHVVTWQLFSLFTYYKLLLCNMLAIAAASNRL